MAAAAATVFEDQKLARLIAYCLKMVCVYILALQLLFSSHATSSSAIIKSLPGFSELLPFKLETGGVILPANRHDNGVGDTLMMFARRYIGVDEKEDVQLFYYFVESEGNPREDPLVLWITGGPGCSALSGFFFEIGPLSFNMVEYNGSLPTLMLNPHSWTRTASVIFVDGPVGTGFSYSRSMQGAKTGDAIYASQSESFIRKWLIGHPEFIRNPFYIGGDSYSGMIFPVIGQEISDGNEARKEPLINLKGYLLGNPITDHDFDGNSKIPFAHRMALISDELYWSTKRSCDGEYIKVDKNNVQCVRNLQAVSECTELIYGKYILEPKCETDHEVHIIHDNRRYLQESYIESPLLEEDHPRKFGCRNYNEVLCKFWAQDHSVQKALNVRKGTVKVWVRCAKDLPFEHDVQSAIIYHLNLSSRGYRVLIYSGDHDMVVPYLGTERWIKSLNFSIVDDWRSWLVDDQVAGYTREYSNHFTFATVKGGGHTAAEYKPKECFAMFKRWIAQQPL